MLLWGFMPALRTTFKMHEDMLYEGIGGKTHKSEPRAMVELNHADGKLVIEAKCQSMP